MRCILCDTDKCHNNFCTTRRSHCVCRRHRQTDPSPAFHEYHQRPKERILGECSWDIWHVDHDKQRTFGYTGLASLLLCHAFTGCFNFIQHYFKQLYLGNLIKFCQRNFFSASSHLLAKRYCLVLSSLAVVLYLQYTTGDQSDLGEINTASKSYWHGSFDFLRLVLQSWQMNLLDSDNIPPTYIMIKTNPLFLGFCQAPGGNRSPRLWWVIGGISMHSFAILLRYNKYFVFYFLFIYNIVNFAALVDCSRKIWKFVLLKIFIIVLLIQLQRKGKIDITKNIFFLNLTDIPSVFYSA